MLSYISVFAATALAAPAAAQEPVYFGDIQVVHQPEAAQYQPEDTTYDLADQGKSFDVACAITPDGKLAGCQSRDNDIYDQNFIRIALSSVGQWVVAPQTLDGQSAAGRTLLVTVKFQPSEPTKMAAIEGAR